jgi:hypothetical protein
MVSPSDAMAMALTSHGERMSFLSAVLSGVSTIAQRNTDVSGARASAGANGSASIVIGRASEVMI